MQKTAKPRSVKRETGENPVRSRHCEQGVQNKARLAQSLGNREDSFCMRICKPGNLPAAGTGPGKTGPDHE